MRMTVIGTGYVGLVSGACFSQLGFTVTCVDRDAAKIDALKNGSIPFFEPGLADMVEHNVAAGRLKFATAVRDAGHADVIFIAVGSPPGDDGLPDRSFLWAVVDTLKTDGTPGAVVVVKSTMPPGTTREVGRRLPGMHAASNPEFLREGSAIADFMKPDRIVCGVTSPEAKAAMEKLYAPLEAPVFFTSPESSEMIKYAANDLLATRIAYINEIADICEKVGADVTDVAQGIGMDARIGPQFLRPGPGFGGSCFPKDVLALVKVARTNGTQSRILEATLASNDARKQAMAEKIIAACGGSVKGKTLAILGVTFKPDTDDMRESPSLSILPALQKAGATLRAYDPEGRHTATPLLPGVEWADSAEAALKDADAAVVITEWREFRGIEPARFAALLKTPVLVDLRNIFDGDAMRRAGMRYVSVGRAEKKPLKLLNDEVEVGDQVDRLVAANDRVN